MTYNIIYYFYNLNKIGGIETFFYQLGKKYKNRDITIIYRQADKDQLDRLSEYFNCVKYNGEKIKGKQALFNFNIDIIDKVEADEYICVLHGDYKDMILRNQILSLPVHPKITKYIGVSKLVCDSFTEITGLPCELCYNPYKIEKYEKPLLLVSATRLSKEKGWDRMEKLIEALDRSGIPYQYHIYTNSPKSCNSPNVLFLKPRLDIEKYYSMYDFLIQLSDNEGFCYSAIEAKTQGCRLITTPLPVLKELNLLDIVVDYDCSNLNQVIEYMTKPIVDLKYSIPKDRWNEILLPIKSTYHNKVEVIATNKYMEERRKDKELDFIPKEGYSWKTSKTRAEFLKSQGFVDIKMRYFKSRSEK